MLFLKFNFSMWFYLCFFNLTDSVEQFFRLVAFFQCKRTFDHREDQKNSGKIVAAQLRPIYFNRRFYIDSCCGRSKEKVIFDQKIALRAAREEGGYGFHSFSVDRDVLLFLHIARITVGNDIKHDVQQMIVKILKKKKNVKAKNIIFVRRIGRKLVCSRLPGLVLVW